jgi:hypothetical protein
VFEESSGPWGPDIYDQRHPNWVERNLQLWWAVQGWAQCVQERKWRKEDGGDGDDGDGDDGDDDDGDDDDEPRYRNGTTYELAFYYTVIMDLSLFSAGDPVRRSKIWEHSPGQPLKWVEEASKEIRGFLGWNYALLRGNKERENDFLELDMIEKPGDLSEDKSTEHDMIIRLWYEENEELKDFHHTVWQIQRGKTFFMTKTGWMGTADGTIQTNDMVVLIAGLEMPFILRPVEDYFRVVGLAHVLGMMDGEQWPKNLSELDLITLI